MIVDVDSAMWMIDSIKDGDVVGDGSSMSVADIPAGSVSADR